MAITKDKYVNIRTVTDGLTEFEVGPGGTGAVSSVNGKTGNVVLTGADIRTTLETQSGPLTATIAAYLQLLTDENDKISISLSEIQSLLPAEATAENKLATVADITASDNAIQEEENRAKIAEDKLSQSIVEETQRATQAEASLSQELTNEVSRAQNAEADLQTQLGATGDALTSETSRATAAEQTLTTAIENETKRAQEAEEELDKDLTAHIDNFSNPHQVTKSQVGLGAVDNTSDMDKPVSTAQASAIRAAVSAEAAARETAIENEATARQTAITAETEARETAISSLETKINDIEDIIPSTATTTNELADKAFVNSTVQTATANFRGNWATWDDVPTNSADYPVDYAGSKVPTVNDYLVVSDASEFAGRTLQGTWRFKYSGVWPTDGKAGWLPEYQVNEEPLTMAQLDALNSGVTSELLTTLQQNISTNANGVSQLNTDLTAGLAQKADTSTVTAQLALKADKSNLESLEATVSDLSTIVSGKADASALGTMASKDAADYSTTLEANTLYASKSLETTVADLSTEVDTKADKSAVLDLSSTVSELNTALSTKADSITVTEGLETKINVAQGIENAGKVLQIDESGNAVPAELPQTQGASLTATQTFTGVNTFQNSANPVVNIVVDNIDSSQTSASAVIYNGLDFRDVNNIRIGKIENTFTTGGDIQTTLSASREVNGSMQYTGLTSGITSTGTKYTRAVTPSASSNTTDIATTAWCRSNGAMVTASQVPSSSNSYTGYIKYSNKFVVQWGQVSLGGAISATNKKVTLPVKMANSAYCVQVSQDANTGAHVQVGWQNPTYFNIGTSGIASTGHTTWYVCGYAA